MRKNFKNIFIVICIGLSWFIISLFCWLNPSQEISASERRSLTQFPPLKIESLVSGEFMKDFEKYAQDQFPFRFKFRALKAYTRFYLLSQKDNNDIYIEEDHAAKLTYPLNENSIRTANRKFNNLYDKYMEDKEVNIFITVVPDKDYYLGANKGYPSMDYERLFEIIKKDTEFAKYIDVTDILCINDYYKTDIHWKQESLVKVAEKIGSALGVIDNLSLEYEMKETNIPFYGVYYGQSALPLSYDNIFYLTNNTIDDCTVYNYETNSYAKVYDIKKLNGRDPYDLYMSGATPLLEVNNPNAKTNKELIVFRDSFGSSLVPLLLEGYSKVTLVDIRYITSDAVGQFIEFNNQDVLFLYSTLILNSATMLK